MDICKFFREGYCRFGSRCRYLHQSSNNYSYGYSDNNSYGKYYGDEYNTKSRQQKGYSGGSSNNSDFNNYRNDNSDQRYKSGSTNNSANQNAYDLWTLIEKEIKILEEGHQWALSCFSVSREYGNVPGWEDHSPEELRYEMYKAIKDGTFEQCKNSITQLYKNAEERRNDFKSKARALPILEALLREKDRRENSNVAANNTQEQNTNLWQNRGVNQQSTGLFGGSSNSAALFGANSSSAQQTNGIFGGNSSSAQQMPGLFAGNSSSTQQMQGLFAGNSSPSQQMPGLFGGNSNSTQIQQSIFGNNQFSNPGETFSFGLNQQQQQIQAQINPSNGFLAGANSVSSPMFQSGASPFQTEQSTQNNPSFFQPMAQQSPQMASSPFNQPVNSSQSVFKPSSEMASSNNQMDYSQQTDLTESELAAFQAKAFKFGHIPLKPPPKEVC